MNETLAQYNAFFAGSNPVEIIAVVLVILAIYFLPAVLAVFFNRKHLVKIAVLNIPAGFSVLVWLGLIVWAVTGKRREKMEKYGRRAGI